MPQNDLEKLIEKASGQSRREPLIHQMSGLESSGAHCGGCSGVCCTFVANSVQTTPLETLDILFYLKREGRLNDPLREKLEAVTRRYRLDQDLPGNGARTFSRRTYTCPFLGEPPKGCGLSRSVKPYGCLGFNPKGSGIEDGENCASDIPLLEEREQIWQEREIEWNRQIIVMLELDWEKRPMPVALLDLWDVAEG